MTITREPRDRHCEQVIDEIFKWYKVGNYKAVRIVMMKLEEDYLADLFLYIFNRKYWTLLDIISKSMVNARFE